MRIFVGYLMVFVLAVTLCFSCRDGGDGSSVAKILTGKWKIVKITTEENYNEASGGVDDNDVVVTFKADGTGGSSSKEGGSAFKWTLAEHDTYLNITDSATAQVMSLKLTKISSSSFTIKDSSTHPAQFEIFKKQNDK